MSFLIFFNQNHASKIRHSITFDIGDNVTISYNGSNITNGQVIKVDDKSKFEAQISVPDKYIPSVSGATLSGNKITIDQVTQDTIIKATATAPCNITISTDEYTHVVDSNNNTIATAGSTTTIKIPYGDPFNANIVRASGYKANDGYTNNVINITSVTSDQNITLSSTAIIYNVTITTDQYSTVTYESTTISAGSSKTFQVQHGGSFFASINWTDGYENDSSKTTSSGSNITISNNAINISSVIRDCSITLVAKKKPVYYTVSLAPQSNCSMSYEGETINPLQVKQYSLLEGSNFEATVNFFDGYEFGSVTGAEYKDGKVIITNIQKDTTITVIAAQIEQPDPEPAQYSITYNISGNAADKVSGTMPKSFNEGDTTSIIMQVPIGYEIEVSSSPTINIIHSEQVGEIEIGRNNYAAFTGVLPAQNITINIVATVCQFNITYNLAENAECASWANLSESNPTTYTYGDNNINFSGSTKPRYKVNEESSNISGYAKLTISQTEVTMKVTDPQYKVEYDVPYYNFTGVISNLSGRDLPIGDIIVNLNEAGVTYTATWNMGDGAVASTEKAYNTRTTSTGSKELMFSCQTGEVDAVALTVFVDRNYKVTNHSVTSDNNITDVQFALFTTLYDKNQTETGFDSSWIDAANAGYSCVYDFVNKRIDNMNYSVTTTKKTFYDVVKTGENYNIELSTKTPAGDTEIVSPENGLREYIDYGFNTNDGKYTLRVWPINEYVFVDDTLKVKVGNTEITGTKEEGTTAYVFSFNATGTLSISAETEFAVKETNLWLDITNKVGTEDSSQTFAMSLTGDNGFTIGNTNETDSIFIEGGGTLDTSNPVNYGDHLIHEEGVTLESWDGSMISNMVDNTNYTINRMKINPKISSDQNFDNLNWYYTIKAAISTDAGNSWITSYESDTINQNDDIDIELLFPDITINNELFEQTKVKLIITVYDEAGKNNLHRLIITDNTRSVSVESNKQVWEPNSLSDASDDTKLKVFFNTSSTDEINVTVFTPETEVGILLGSICSVGCTVTSPIEFPNSEVQMDKLTGNIEIVFDNI